MGIESNKLDLMGDSLIILQTSFSPTGSKALKAGGEQAAMSRQNGLRVVV